MKELAIFTRFGAALLICCCVQVAAWAQWSQQGSKLTGAGAAGAAGQGAAVAISADGNTAIVGGYNDSGNVGAAWVYTRSGGVWTQQGSKLVGNDAVGVGYQGIAVSLSADGNTAMVGGAGDDGSHGAAWVYTRSGGVWTQQGSKLVGNDATSNSYQGGAVSLSADGNTAIVGGAGDDGSRGAIWVYTRSGGVWTQQGSKLIGTNGVGLSLQGSSVSLSADGNTAVAGAYYDNSTIGAAWIFTRASGVWSQQGSKLVGTGAVGAAYQGYSVSISADGNTAAVGGYADDASVGAVWVYTRTNGVWTQQGSKLVGSGVVGTAAYQGISVSLSGDGNTALVGGDADNISVGAAWVYTRINGAWFQQGSKLVGTGVVGYSDQGFSVAISSDGSTALVGAENDSSNVGAAYVYTFNGAPALTSIRDIPADQGGKVRLRWTRSSLDTAGAVPQAITYGVWRRVPSGASPKTGRSQVPLGILDDTLGTNYDYVASIPAVGSDVYNYVATTLADSVTGNANDETFVISAHAADVNLFWVSASMAGYSVDNLDPVTPAGAALSTVGLTAYRVSWNPDEVDPDLKQYNVYRSTTSGFSISPSNLLAATNDTTDVDSTVASGQQYYYRVASMDVHGNVSAPTQELSLAPLAIELGAFAAQSVGVGSITLDWWTTTETNNYGFFVERARTQGAAFVIVSPLIPGAGTTLTRHDYSWVDTTVVSGTYVYRLLQVDLNGHSSFSSNIVVTVSSVEGVLTGGKLPSVYALEANYPNPFNPTTTIAYQLPKESFVHLSVFNMLGQEVRTLVNQTEEAGFKSVTFDGSNLASGLYLYRLTATSNGAAVFTEVKKLVLVK